jgi:hypothetical protein
MLNIYYKNAGGKISLKDKNGMANLISKKDNSSKKSISKAQRNFSKNSKSTKIC